MLSRLQEISEMTGGMAFEVRQSDEIATAFNRIGADLQHLYLLAYYPSAQESTRWRKINVLLPEQKKSRCVRRKDICRS
jgi:hypothetical protein